MISEIIITNVKTGESVTISQSSNQFVLDYVDWDTPIVTMDSYRVPFQIGESISGVTVGRRSPTIYGYVVSPVTGQSILGMTWEQYYQMQEQGINDNKEILDRLISVYQDIRIDVGEYHLDCRPTASVKYSSNEQENNEVMCYFAISLDCFDPLFYRDEETYDLASVDAKFHFPLIFPQGSGIVFGEIMKRQSVAIENSGDVDVGCTIVVRSTGGTVSDPRIYNVNTGEYIEFQGVTLDDGDYITITTETGEENAIKHDTSESTDVSIVGNMLEGSTFLRITQGSDMYAYSVDEEQMNNLEVYISFVPKYFNVRGM